ncbi:MAG: 1-deoxy-D-xylulose-5-phosphate reductoisomerase, partial [Mycobacteriales bacterium]
TVQQALAHPTWQMGPVITVNSATLVNKGLELIEAHELFDVPYNRIDVVVHPESVVHSMVEFCDGSTVAQLSRPDMRLTIGLALAWPHRLRTVPAQPPGAVPPDSAAWSWRSSRPDARAWSFSPLDEAVFPAVALARAAGMAGQCRPAIFNAANEECVAAFRRDRLPFADIVPVVAEVLAAAPSLTEPRTVEDVVGAQRWARVRANKEIVGRT